MAIKSEDAGGEPSSMAYEEESMEDIAGVPTTTSTESPEADSSHRNRRKHLRSPREVCPTDGPWTSGNGTAMSGWPSTVKLDPHDG